MFFKGKADGGGQGRSIGNYRASLHAYGGALYSVTCSQRKDHYTRLCLLARSPANGCFAAAVFVALSLVDSPPKPWTIPAHPLPGSTQAERICLPYAVVEMRLTVSNVNKIEGKATRRGAKDWVHQRGWTQFFIGRHDKQADCSLPKKLYKKGKLCYSVKESHGLFSIELSRRTSAGANGGNKP